MGGLQDVSAGKGRGRIGFSFGTNLCDIVERFEFIQRRERRTRTASQPEPIHRFIHRNIEPPAACDAVRVEQAECVLCGENLAPNPDEASATWTKKGGR